MQTTSSTKTNQQVIDEAIFLYRFIKQIPCHLIFPNKLSPAEVTELFEFFIQEKILIQRSYQATKLFKSYPSLNFPYCDVWINTLLSDTDVILIHAGESFLRLIKGSENQGASIWYTLTGKPPQ